MAKRFFYVCAGLLCLALTYYLGARSATAQGPVLSAADVDDHYHSAVSGRIVYTAHKGTLPGPLIGHQVLPPVPGASPVIAVNVTGNSNPAAYAILENGDVYDFDGNTGTWSLSGNMIGGVTPMVRSSFGGLKARYRGEREPQGVKPNTNR